RAGSASRPVRQLKGFQRVTLAAGAKQTLHFKLGPDELQFWSPSRKQWVVEPEQFDVWVGEDSTAKLHSEFRLIPYGIIRRFDSWRRTWRQNQRLHAPF